MVSSLRSRQLISSFGVIMVGILVLGIMLHWFSYRYKIEQEELDLAEKSFVILGYFSFENNKLDVLPDADIRAALKQQINEYGLNDPEQKQFAYIVDTATDKVVWSTQRYEVNAEEGVETQDYYLRFPLEPRPAGIKPDIQQLRPLPPQDRSKLDDLTFQQMYNQEYLLVVHNIDFQDLAVAEQRRHFQFVVGKSIANIQREMQDMRKKFAILLFLSAVLVLIAQLALSFWIIAPIRDFEAEVKAIELGERERVEDDYPEELLPVKHAVNALLSYEKGQKQRYKDTLDDLAHSLKTPLAAMQNQLEHLAREPNPSPQVEHSIKIFASQLARMHEIVSHQLRRAIVTNQGAMILSQPLRPVLMRLRETLLKVYREKDFDIRINVDEYAKCRMDNEDMMELFGNLLNNACRFCQHLVEVSAHLDNNMLIVDIDDDGMGFPTDNPAKLLQRGVREDSKSEGQGIGLAVSTEIVSAVGGKIELMVSPQMGARVRLHLPV